jgi:hypothetical protein
MPVGNILTKPHLHNRYELMRYSITRDLDHTGSHAPEHHARNGLRREAWLLSFAGRT